MVLPSLPQTLIPAVSFLAWFAVNWLKHSALPTWANALIALLVPVFVAWLWAIASSALTAQNLWGNIAIIVVLSYAALALPELESWRQWLQDTFKSPFAWIVPAQPQPITATTVPATPTPYGIDLPAPMPASSRVSRIPFDSSFHPMPPVLSTGSVRIVAQPSQTTPPLLPPGAMQAAETSRPVEEPTEQS